MNQSQILIAEMSDADGDLRLDFVAVQAVRPWSILRPAWRLAVQFRES
jgi:hypothetical protein